MNSKVFFSYQMIISLTLAFNSSLVRAQSVKVGEADVFPSVKLSYISNSNTYLTKENEITSTGLRVSPLVSFTADRRLLSVKLSYEGDYASFSEDPLDYDDHKLHASLQAEFNSRSRASFVAEISKEHEEFGTRRTLGEFGDSGEAVEYFDSSVDGSYTFGATSARGNITGGLLLSNTAFLNRDDLTRGADNFEITPYGRFSYRLTPKTRALFELRYSSLEFDSSVSDRSEIQALAGFDIQPGGKTSGEIKLGLGRADYANSGIPGTSFLVVNTNVAYFPTNKAKLLIEYERKLDDTDGVGLSEDQEQTISDTAKLSWQQTISAFVSSNTYIALEILDSECPALGQSTFSGGIEVAYSIRSWFQIGAGFEQESRSSDRCSGIPAAENSDYEKQTISIFSKITL